MKSSPSITIAICTYNRAEYLKDTLNDLAAQTADADPFEILVINNRSTDHTSQVCSDFGRNHPDLHFREVFEPLQGLSHARNRAVREATHDLILYIDDDVHLPDGFISQSNHYLRENPDIVCAGGRIFVSFDDEASKPGWIPSELMPMFGLHDLGESPKKYPRDNYPRGGNMLIHKRVFRETGLFDPELGRSGAQLHGSEEKAFFDRARRAGYECWYLPGMSLYHRIGMKRLSRAYLKEQSVGIGKSEFLRLRGKPLRLIQKFLSEMIKLGGSLLLSAGYLLRGNFRAAWFLLVFRFWVLEGFSRGGGSRRRKGTE